MTPKPSVVFGVLKGKVWVAGDFDDEDAEINALFYGEDAEPPKRGCWSIPMC